MSDPIMDFITSSALSLTMAGNTGISPFLTLLILGVVESYDPTMLNMDERIETILSSWWSLAILGLMTIAELIGKSFPVVDEIIDSAEVFIVPAVSVLASMATMGLLPGAESSQVDQNIDEIGLFEGDSKIDGFRSLQAETDDSNDFGEGFITFTKTFLVIFGSLLALSIHFLKMLVRLASLACSGGACQPCITLLEFFVVIFGVIFAIVFPIFALVACIVFLAAAAYVIRRKCCKKDSDDTTKNDGDAKDEAESAREANIEDQSPSIHAIPTDNARSSKMADLEDVPLPLSVIAKPY
eukprot:jgi/Psemu1/301773/fgenesh1_kg.44_\